VLHACSVKKVIHVGVWAHFLLHCLCFLFVSVSGCTVRDRMVYAASSAALKDGLGQSNFDAATFSISKPAEASASDYTSVSRSMSQDELLTLDEKEKRDGEMQSAMSMGSGRSLAIVGLPIKASDEALAALTDAQKGQHSTVILLLNSETEVLQVQKAGDFSFEQVQGMLPPTEPRYVLHNFAHEHEGKQTKAFVFAYYCPDDIRVRIHTNRHSSCTYVVAPDRWLTNILFLGPLFCVCALPAEAEDVLLYLQASRREGVRATGHHDRAFVGAQRTEGVVGRVRARGAVPPGLREEDVQETCTSGQGKRKAAWSGWKRIVTQQRVRLCCGRGGEPEPLNRELPPPPFLRGETPRAAGVGSSSFMSSSC
jgi:hypothetical protein